MISLLQSVGPYVAILLGFGFIIFIHELGHFLVAKAVGIKCTQFAIGFGHSLLAYRKGIGFRVGTTEPEYKKMLAEGVDAQTLGETEYRLNWMPLGGYVKMLGQEDMDPNAVSEDPRAFNCKPVWARAAVISAGVVMNLIFAIVFFVAAFMAGVDFPPSVVGQLDPRGAAATAYANDKPQIPAWQGLRPGDHITHVDDELVTDMMQVAIKSALSSPGQSLHLVVEREGVDVPLTFDIEPKIDTRPPYLLAIGIAPPMSLVVQTGNQSGTLPSLLADAQVAVGMKVVAVDSKPVTRFDQFYEGLTSARGGPVQVRFEDVQAGTSASVMMKAQPQLTFSKGDKAIHLMGLVPATQITKLVPGSVAEEIGLQAGDIIASLGSARWPSIHDVPTIVAPQEQSKTSPTLTMEVLRQGKIVSIGSVQPRDGKLGIYMAMATDVAIVSYGLSGSPADALNLTAGSTIKSINEHPVNSFDDMQRWLTLICEKAQGPIDIHVGFELNVKDNPHFVRKVTINTEQAQQLVNAKWTLPAQLGPGGSSVFGMLKHRVQAQTPREAIGLGLTKTHQFMMQTYVTLARLFQGTVKPEHLRGPIGIVHEGTRIAKQGWPYLMFFLGLISVNLVVINFLPIPIVDGGLMVFLIVEKIKGSPVSIRIQSAAMVVGLVMIAGIFLMTLWYDIGRIEMFKGLFGKLF